MKLLVQLPYASDYYQRRTYRLHRTRSRDSSVFGWRAPMEISEKKTKIN